MEKHKKGTNEPTGQTGTLESAKDWMGKSDAVKVQNPDQNKEIHKQSLGPNARR